MGFLLRVMRGPELKSALEAGEAAPAADAGLSAALPATVPPGSAATGARSGVAMRPALGAEAPGRPTAGAAVLRPRSERLRRADLEPDGLTTLVNDILRNLRHILGTRRLYGYFVDDYGLDCYTSSPGAPSSIDQLAAQVSSTVIRYEPRLEDVQVKPMGRDRQLWQYLDLSGGVCGYQCDFLVQVHTLYGDVQVSLLQGS